MKSRTAAREPAGALTADFESPPRTIAAPRFRVTTRELAVDLADLEMEDLDVAMAIQDPVGRKYPTIAAG